MKYVAVQAPNAQTGSTVLHFTAQHLRDVECRSTFWNDYLLESFVALEIVSQLALAFVQMGSFRPLVRFLSYAASLGLMVFLPGSGRLSPAAKAVWAVI